MSACPQNHDLRAVLMAGGHSSVSGGLEMFVARAKDCVGLTGHVFTETPGRLRPFLTALGNFLSHLPGHDIVWLHYGSAFDLLYLLLAKLLGRKVAVTPHLGDGWRSMRNPVVRTLCNRLLSLADVVFTLYETQPLSLRFPSSLARKCCVMGTFLPRSLLEREVPLHAPSAPLRLAHVARLSAGKGSFAFLDVLEALDRRGIVYEASLIGPTDAETMTALKHSITQRGLTVSILGALPQEQLLPLLARQDVLVNLSLQDAYPLTVIEALLSGVVPVCCALPGTRELARTAPVIALIDGQDGEAAATRIAAIDWSALPAAAEAVKTRFSWAQLARRYGEVFTRLRAKSIPAVFVPAVEVRVP